MHNSMLPKYVINGLDHINGLDRSRTLNAARTEIAAPTRKPRHKDDRRLYATRM